MSTEPQADDAYKHVAVPTVPSATIDVASIETLAGQTVWLLSGPTPLGRGAVYPVDLEKQQANVPAGVPILPIVVENQVPVRIGEPLTVRRGERASARVTSSPTRGDVVTWIEFDRETYLGTATANYRPMKTVLLTADGKRIESVFPIATPHNAWGELQIFRNVPPGRGTILVDADGWEESDTLVAVVADRVTLTGDALLAVPAAVVHAHYLIDAGAVDLGSATKQSCGQSEAPHPVTISAYRCDKEIADPNAIDLSLCAPVRNDMPLGPVVETTFPRLRSGRYVFEASHPILGRIRKPETLLPGDEKSVELVANIFPIFGRITRGGKPVKVELRFAEGSRGAGTAVSDADGRFEVLLPASPGAQGIEIAACDKTFDYSHEPDQPPAINAPLDIDIPATSLEVVVTDDSTGEAIPNAIVYVSTPREDGNVRFRRRAAADENGIARFTSVVIGVDQKACGLAARAGYLRGNCTAKFALNNGEDRKIELRMQKDGVLQGKLVTSSVYEPAMLTLMSAEGFKKEDIRVSEGTFWLKQLPAAGDYFVLIGPGQPLYVLTSWQMDGKTMILTTPAARVRSVAIRGGAANDRRMVAVRIGGRRVDQSALSLHLQNLRVNPLSTWTDGQVLPLIAETAPISVTLGPPMSEYVALGLEGPEVFMRPEFANRLPTVVVPPDRDEVMFP